MSKIFGLFALIAVIITLIWFRQGLMYGGAEVGLLTFNPQRSLQIQQFIWWASSAPGMLVPHYISGVPFYFVLSLFQSVFSPVSLQAVIFFILLFLMGFGMYSFSLSIVGEQKRIYAILGGLFYMFNSYTMVVVWHRFLYTSFILAASLPILLLFWRQWIKRGKLLFLVLFLLTSLASSYMLGSLALSITVWLSLLLISIADVFPWRGKVELINLVWRFAIGIFFWLITNIWWLIPFLTVSTGLLSEQHSIEDNINTLVNISNNQTLLFYTLQLANPFYLFFTAELGKIYNSLIFKIFPWIPIIVIFTGLTVALKRKIFAAFAIIYILIIFFSKGAAAPWGYSYIWFFKNIYALGVIRNPFEKLGIMMPLFGSILFIIGLEFIFTLTKRKSGLLNAILINVAILLSILVFAWPMFFGTVLKKPVDEVLIQVPDYYKQANDWLNSQKDRRGNILHLPYSGRDVVTYDWEFGYHGVDINELLFDNFPSITRNLGMKTVDDTLSSFTNLFHEPYVENKEQVIKILQNLDVNFIILHKDVEWTDIDTYGKNIKFTKPDNLETILNTLDFLEKKTEIGKLIIYKFKNDYYQPKIILSESANLVYPGRENYLQITSLFGSANEIVTPQQDSQVEQELQHIKSISIFPENHMEYLLTPASVFEKMANDLQSNPDTYGSVINILQVIRNYFSQRHELVSEELVKKIIESTKNLAKLQSDNILNRNLTSNFNDYQRSLTDIFRNNFKSLELLKLYRSQITNTFYLHLYILEQLGKNKSNDQDRIFSVRKHLIDELKMNGLIPNNISSDEISNQEVNKRVFQFNVPAKSKYELLLIAPRDLDLYPDLLSNLNVRINDKLIDQEGKGEKNIFSFGEFDFNKGTYEISYNSILSPNLVPGLDKFLRVGNVEFLDKETAHLTSDLTDMAYLESPIRGVSGKDIFFVAFDATSDGKNEFSFELMQDAEEFDSSKEFQIVKSGECARHECYTIKLGTDLNRMIMYSQIIPPLSMGSQRANIRINVYSRQTPGNVYIKNIQVNKVFNGNIVLRKIISNGDNNLSSKQAISFIRHSPTLYFGKIKLSKPSFMFFKETFHPGWVLRLIQGDKIYKIDNHYLGNLYNNAYFIGKIGEYDFKLEFEPQKNADFGLIISLTGWLSILILLTWQEFKARI